MKTDKDKRKEQMIKLLGETAEEKETFLAKHKQAWKLKRQAK